MSFLSIDFETRSEIDLRKTGVYPYAAHQSTDVWCMSYAVPGSEPKTWLPGMPVPPVFHECIRRGLPFRAWNSSFEHIIYRDIMVPRYGFPAVPTEIWIDTAAEAAALALPRSLGQAARVLGLPQQKDDEGYKLMLKMCRPRAIGAWWYDYGIHTHGPFATKGLADDHRKMRKIRPSQISFRQDTTSILWWDDAADLDRLAAYCEDDVRTEMAVAELILDLSPVEQEVFNATQRMNDRGVGVDLQMVSAAIDLNETAMIAANKEIQLLTNNEVDGVTKVHQMRAWINRNSTLELDNLRKDTVRDTLNDATLRMPAQVREVLQLRQDAGKTSTAKLAAFEHCAATDGRVHGLLMYHGASTGRWSGRLIQPQNFPRPTLDVDPLIGYIKGRGYDELVATGHSVPNIISSSLRSMICAAPGHELIVGDYSQIEARVLAWLAGQDDLVELFRNKGKVYEDMAAFIFGLKVDDVAKDSFERQIGKNSVLGCGFQMGADRFAEQVREQTGIVLDRGGEYWFHGPCGSWGPPVLYHPDGNYDHSNTEDWNCCSMMSGPGPCTREDIAQKAITGYRTKNDKIVQFWKDIEQAAIGATLQPGRVFTCGAEDRIKFKFHGKFLWCGLPSGRRLAYAMPEVRMKNLPAPYEDVEKPALCYRGVNSVTRQWGMQWSYGGHLTENVTQAVARDLMAAAILRVEREGYSPILTVHDEVACEERTGTRELDDFLAIMNHVPRWAKGLPVASEGYTAERYRK